MKRALYLDGLKISYTDQGTGEVVLLLHGFPTSSYLWRNMAPTIALTHRVIAIDLPGFGDSDKPKNASYSLNYYLKVLDQFLSKLEIESLHLVVHDLGGPIGLLWAVRNKRKVESLTFLNTLVYSQFSWGVLLFVLMLKMPFIRNWLVSPAGIRWTMNFGTFHDMDRNVISAYQAPFATKADRLVLLKTAANMSIKGFKEIEGSLTNFDFPTQAIFGANDRILPRVAWTMSQLEKQLPNLHVTALNNCGHFLQEDDPATVAKLIAEFVNKVTRKDSVNHLNELKYVF